MRYSSPKLYRTTRYYAYLPYNLFLYSLADIPTTFLNTLEKCAISENPTFSAISPIRSAGSFNISFAFSIRIPFRISEKFCPRYRLRSLLRCHWLT